MSGEVDKCKLQIQWNFSKVTSFNEFFAQTQINASSRGSVPCSVSELIYRWTRWLTVLPSVYIHLVLLLREAQHGMLCRAIQVQQTTKLCRSA